MTEFQRLEALAKRYKELYKPGDRIELECMGEDPRPIPPGTRGTVRVVDDIGTVHCDFDNGRRLGLVPGEDSFCKLTYAEVMEEQRIRAEWSTAGRDFAKQQRQSAQSNNHCCNYYQRSKEEPANARIFNERRFRIEGGLRDSAGANSNIGQAEVG